MTSKPKNSKPSDDKSASLQARQAARSARTATLGLAVAMLVAAVGGGIAYWATEADAYIGTVDGHRIDKADFDRSMAARRSQLTAQLGVNADSDQGQHLLASAQQQVIGSLVDRQIQLDEAASRSLGVTDSEVETRLRAIRAQFPDEQSFDHALSQNGFSLDALRHELREEALISKLRDALTRAATVSVADSRAYYDKNPAQFTRPEQVEASHILVKTQAEAAAIEAKLEEGGDFATLARQFSIDTGSKSKGGDLGFFPRGRMVPAFEKAAFALKPGEISPLVKTQFGYHILKGGPHQPAHRQTFEEARAPIDAQLLKQQQDAEFQTWETQQRQRAKVVIRPRFSPPK